MPRVGQEAPAVEPLSAGQPVPAEQAEPGPAAEPLDSYEPQPWLRSRPTGLVPDWLRTGAGILGGGLLYIIVVGLVCLVCDGVFLLLRVLFGLLRHAI